MSFDGDLQQLQRSLSGTVALPGSAEYQQTIDIDNGRVRLPPRFVVAPRSADDIGSVVAFAQHHDLGFTVKGGGHSAAGYALNRGGVVLDMSSLKSMHLDSDTDVLNVEMGARWEEVYEFVAGQDDRLLPIGGGCLTVGLPGFLLGGGYSFSSRSYGMGSDSVLSIELVTADGVVHHLTADSHDPTDQELWWACRGGGGGSFGIAVSMQLQIHRPPTPKMLVGEVTYRLSEGLDVIGTYNDWIETLPNEMACYGYLGRQPDPAHPGEMVESFRITPVFNGPYAQGIELLQPMLRLPAIRAELFEMSLPRWEAKIGTGTLVGDKLAYIRSGVMPAGGMTRDVIEIYQRYMDSAPSPDSFVVWTHGGGRIAEIDSAASAFPHRDGRFIFELKAIWTDPNDTRANVEWAYSFLEELRPHLTGAYVNYIDPLLTDWRSMYYADNYERLDTIKQHVDPDNFFAFQQAIGSSFEPSGTEPLDLSPLNRTIV